MTPTPRFEPRQELQQVPVLVGTSGQSTRMRDFVDMVAPTEHTVFLRGETGVGKDHMAELIHFNGRRGRSFVPVDCVAMTETLSETELFGHTQGAFTDARSSKPGLVQVAEDGTLFLNEVGDIPLGLQARFLRLLEKKTFRVVGGTREVPINTRIIAATNRNLEVAVKRGEFRLDLYHRLNVITFVVPTLRERTDDIPVLAEHFLQQEQVVKPKGFSPTAMTAMMEYRWPGNVRELKLAVVRAVLHSAAEENIELEHVYPYLMGVGDKEKSDIDDVSIEKFPTLREAEEQYLREVLKRTGGNVAEAARIAGINRKTMYSKIETFRLQDFFRSLKA